MRCVITEPRNKETIVALPVRITAQSAFSKYTISPHTVNFGPFVYSSKTSRAFTISNNGLFDFRYVCNMCSAFLYLIISDMRALNWIPLEHKGLIPQRVLQSSRAPWPLLLPTWPLSLQTLALAKQNISFYFMLR
jgi:hypothetical protein